MLHIQGNYLLEMMLCQQLLYVISLLIFVKWIIIIIKGYIQNKKMTCFASIFMTKVCTYIIINPVFYAYLKYLDKPVMLHMLLFQLPSWPDLSSKRRK